jgi:hypothetical protein
MHPDLLWDACTNIYMGAFVLAQMKARYGDYLGGGRRLQRVLHEVEGHVLPQGTHRLRLAGLSRPAAA